MFHAKMAQKSIFFSLVVLFLINQVSAKKCYFCSASMDSECLSNPSQKKYEYECQMFAGKGSLFNNLGLASIPSPVFNGLDESEYGPIEFQCASMVLTDIITGNPSLTRGCLPKHLSDETFNVLAVMDGVQVNNIRRCHGELCNHV